MGDSPPRLRGPPDRAARRYAPAVSDAIVLRQSRSRLALSVVITLAFIVLGVGLFLEAIHVIDLVEHRPGQRPREGAGLVVGPLAVAGFGWLLVPGVRAIAAPRTLLTTDPDGFDHPSSVGRVRWRDVTGWKVVELAAGTNVVVHVRNTSDFLRSRANDRERESVESNLRVSERPIVIPVKEIHGGAPAVLAAFERTAPLGLVG